MPERTTTVNDAANMGTYALPNTDFTVNDLALEIFVKARRWLNDEGWGKGSMHDGGWCLAGALTAVWDAEFGEDALIRAEQILGHVLYGMLTPDERAEMILRSDYESGCLDGKCSDSMEMTVYKDLPTTIFADVMALIELGITSLEPRSKDLSRLNFASVIVVVDWNRDLDEMNCASERDFEELLSIRRRRTVNGQPRAPRVNAKHEGWDAIDDHPATRADDLRILVAIRCVGRFELQC